MTVTAETERAAAPPTFPYKAYGVSLNWIGEDGGMVAERHVPFRRFVAACNCVSRKELRIRNLADDRDATLDDILVYVTHQWALPITSSRAGEFEWEVRLHDVTADTPGALPVTLFWPAL